MRCNHRTNGGRNNSDDKQGEVACFPICSLTGALLNETKLDLTTLNKSSLERREISLQLALLSSGNEGENNEATCQARVSCFFLPISPVTSKKIFANSLCFLDECKIQLKSLPLFILSWAQRKTYSEINYNFPDDEAKHFPLTPFFILLERLSLFLITTIVFSCRRSFTWSRRHLLLEKY